LACEDVLHAASSAGDKPALKNDLYAVDGARRAREVRGDVLGRSAAASSSLPCPKKARRRRPNFLAFLRFLQPRLLKILRALRAHLTQDTVYRNCKISHARTIYGSLKHVLSRHCACCSEASRLLGADQPDCASAALNKREDSLRCS
jgi:hypothetical protein